MVSFIAQRAHALEHLQTFLLQAGEDYARERNFDMGAGAHNAVSCLSPWIRVRSLSEEAVARTVLSAHSLQEAEKFIQEVCWRTYWKGWLRQRPRVWDDYLAQLADARRNIGNNRDYQRAIEGTTDFQSFNKWVDELKATGYLHNHARMWFASIWIHTLKLPWVLGAALFMEHLLDGDCASNTLSWRWVAGLQTLGKSYAATSSNIQKFTRGRLGAGEQFSHAIDLPADLSAHPKAIDIKKMPPPDISEHTGLILTDDDLRAWECFDTAERFTAIAAVFPTGVYNDHRVAAWVQDFRKALMLESLEESTTDPQKRVFIDQDLEAQVLRWAAENQLKEVVIAEPAVGFWSGLWPALKDALEGQGIRVVEFRRPWDEAFFPHAKKGFFNLKKQIPKLIHELV